MGGGVSSDVCGVSIVMGGGVSSDGCGVSSDGWRCEQ